MAIDLHCPEHDVTLFIDSLGVSLDLQPGSFFPIRDVLTGRSRQRLHNDALRDILGGALSGPEFGNHDRSTLQVSTTGMEFPKAPDAGTRPT
jgi:hypothetical protein